MSRLKNIKSIDIPLLLENNSSSVNELCTDKSITPQIIQTNFAV